MTGLEQYTIENNIHGLYVYRRQIFDELVRRLEEELKRGNSYV